MKAIVLAAGIGSRLGNPFPKALTLLQNGCSIMQLQIKNLLRYMDINDIIVVVGYKKELIMEAFPDLMFVYNDYFDTTNTAKSLLRGLLKIKAEDVLWINGDVVFGHGVIKKIFDYSDHSLIAVNKMSVGKEEVKYTLNVDGSILKVSKDVENGLGEALGINMVKAKDLDMLRESLMECTDKDYFEKGIESAIVKGLSIYPLDISEFNCVEVDFVEDLEKANSFLSKLNKNA